MPELPEVETIIRGLKKRILNLKIKDVWSDAKKIIKKPQTFSKFKSEIKNRKILNLRRRGKNILIDLSGNKVLLIHQKISGHLLYGEWGKEKDKWVSKIPGALSEDSWNQYLHLIFFLNNNEQVALSDLRKFAKVELWNKQDLKNSKSIKHLGFEPLERNLTFEKFKNILNQRKRGKIKQILMDQEIIVGIGNIYANEILWES